MLKNASGAADVLMSSYDVVKAWWLSSWWNSEVAKMGPLNSGVQDRLADAIDQHLDTGALTAPVGIAL